MERPSVALETLGCRLNQAESEELARRFLAAGYRMVSPSEGADVYILNTCTVTGVADRKARRRLRWARRCNPSALVVAAGCYAERATAEVSRIQGVDVAVDNHAKEDLVSLVQERLGSRAQRRLPRSRGLGYPPSLRQAQGKLYPSPARGEGTTSSPSTGEDKDGGERADPNATNFRYMTVGTSAEGEGQCPLPPRSRPLVKLQEGCSLGCTYCIVPRVRGPEQSVPAPQVLAQVGARAAAGYQEVALTGTLLGAYRWQGMDLTALLERLLAESPIRRFRLSSMLPQDLTPALLRLWGTGRLCRHLHLPLQSGSQSVLEKMRRPYSSAQYEEAVTQARQSAPDLALTTDIMVGFPGESDEEFEESYRFCQRMDFARIHVFSYSRRPGTLATKMPQVEARTKHERARKMLDLAQQNILHFHRRFVGQTLPVLWEGKKDSVLSLSKGGVWEGLTDNYLRVFTFSSEELQGRITPARLVAPYGEGLWGEVAGHVR